MSDCVFCKIIAGELPSNVVFENEYCKVIHDIEPKAPVHLVALCKQHIPSLDEARQADVLGQCLLAAAAAAQKMGLMPQGYRVVTNIGKHGAQSVPHLHFHVLGGAQLLDEMG